MSLTICNRYQADVAGDLCPECSCPRDAHAQSKDTDECVDRFLELFEQAEREQPAAIDRARTRERILARLIAAKEADRG
jgi:hypothetical protein